MVFAKVKGIHSLEIPNLETYIADDHDVFCIAIRVMVGPRGDEGEESFDIRVYTPGWLAQACERDGFVVGRHFLVVNSYSWDHLRSTLVNLIENCAGESWKEVAEKVGRIGHWEFEDYKR